MNNPYKILGVSPEADDEEIKRVYRELARKYHPDRYSDSDLADLASEKMKEINAAYEEIMQRRATGNADFSEKGGKKKSKQSEGGWQTSGNNNYRNSSQYSDDAKSKFTAIRNCINSGNISEAERLLQEVYESDRGAEWVFLTGCVQLHKGFYVDAQHSFETAYRMEPTNNEYWSFMQRMHQKAGRFGGGYQQSNGGNSTCDLCSSLICADCLCECMGGDLISCC